MRLIDADSLYDALGDKLTWLMGYGDDVYLTVGSDIRDTIDNQPTAYDIDKVVAELEELAESHRQAGYDVEKNGFSNIADKMYGKQCAFMQAIEIVKQGGVEINQNRDNSKFTDEDLDKIWDKILVDDCCEWRIVDRPNNLPIFNTSCGKIRLQYSTGIDVYCNGCGKKIKVIGD